jgi:hypothetical protein
MNKKNKKKLLQQAPHTDSGDAENLEEQNKNDYSDYNPNDYSNPYHSPKNKKKLKPSKMMGYK